MAYYAMVVVVEARDENAAHRGLSQALAPVVTQFVGEPWEVAPLVRASRSDAVFETAGCVDQHPEIATQANTPEGKSPRFAAIASDDPVKTWTFDKDDDTYDAPCPVCGNGPLDLKGHGAVCPNGHITHGE